MNLQKLKKYSGTLTVIVIYRPPYSKHHPVTVKTFLTEFSDYSELIITAPGKLIIGGDFNIHIDDGNNANARQLLDLLQGFCLMNHVWLPTHISGHTLVLIITND